MHEAVHSVQLSVFPLVSHAQQVCDDYDSFNLFGFQRELVHTCVKTLY